MTNGATSLSAGLCAELSIEADSAEIRRASIWIAKTGMDFGVPMEQLGRLDICLNEVLANVIEHGGEEAISSPIGLEFLVSRLDPSNLEAAITVSDSGLAFDPLSFEQKPRTHSLEEAEPGGLGLTMMQEFVDSLSYRYRDGQNRLTFCVRWLNP